MQELSLLHCCFCALSDITLHVQMTIFWNVASRSLHICARRFWGAFRVHHQGKWMIHVTWWRWNVGMYLPEQTRRHISEDTDLHSTSLEPQVSLYRLSELQQLTISIPPSSKQFCLPRHVRNKSVTQLSPNQWILGAPYPVVKRPKVVANHYNLPLVLRSAMRGQQPFLFLYIVVGKLYGSYVCWNLNTVKWPRFGYPRKSCEA